MTKEKESRIEGWAKIYGVGLFWLINAFDVYLASRTNTEQIYIVTIFILSFAPYIFYVKCVRGSRDVGM